MDRHRGVEGPPQPAREAPTSPVAVVTGAAGFIGRHLVGRLVADGWRVRALDLNAPGVGPPGDPPTRDGPAGRPGVTWHRVDIRDREALEPNFEGAHTVFHLASAHLEAGAPESWFREVNVDGTLNVARAARRHRVPRMVHVGSVGVYGHVATPPADETGPFNPNNAYERTKLEGERALLAEAAETGTLAVLRPGWVYGPGCARTERLLRAVARGRFVYVGRGDNLRHPIHVDDAVEALLRADRWLEAGAPAPERSSAGDPVFLVVGARAVTVRELVETAARILEVRPARLRLPRLPVRVGLAAVEGAFALLGRTPPVSRRSLAFFENDNAFDGSRARDALGFEPQVALDEGLRQTAVVLGMVAVEPARVPAPRPPLRSRFPSSRLRARRP